MGFLELPNKATLGFFRPVAASTVSLRPSCTIRLNMASASPKKSPRKSPRAPVQYSHGKPLQKPVFCTVKDCEPEKRGVNIVAKVLSVRPVSERVRFDGTKTVIAEAHVGDASGCIDLVVKNADQVDVLQAGKSIIIRNAHIEMVGSNMKLTVDKWGLVEFSRDEVQQVDESNNVSAIEYVLV